ncbi:MAG: hypothetical protein MZV64_10470 [Ignavibacteriales bacterium]|nr:hypothetical protein [Ignavibacteriales bacterium]
MQPNGTSDKTWLVSGYARMDFQITPTTRLNLFYESDNKQKWGRTNWGSEIQAPDTVWNQIGPGGLYKGELDQTLGNLYLNIKGIYTDGGFELVPVLSRPERNVTTGPYVTALNYPTEFHTGNIDDYGTDRNQTSLSFSGNYFAENVLGGDHGIQVRRRLRDVHGHHVRLLPGQLTLHYGGPDDRLPTGEWWEAWLLRDYIINYDFNRYSASSRTP